MTSDKVIPTYWWGNNDNWGDLLSPVLVEHFTEHGVVWSDPVLAQLTCLGSILDSLPPKGWNGIVAGSGLLRVNSVVDLTDATVLGLRGPLTAERVTLHPHTSVAMGDPGLLVSEVVQPVKKTIEIGVVPHWSDTELFDKEMAKSHSGKYVEPTLIDITRPPLEVVAQITACKKVVASSLHALITADAYGIPRRAETFSGMFSVPWEGKFFKFLDYHASIGMSLEFGQLAEAPAGAVEARTAEVFDMMIRLKEVLSE